MRKALFFLACFSIVFCFNGANAEEQNVKIGFLSPQTGPIEVYAEGMEMGGEIAIDDLNTKYDGEYNFELVIADSACNGDDADDAAEYLVNQGVVGIAGAACSGATLGAMPVAKDAQIPLISYSSTSPDITDADDDGYLWRVVPSDDQIGLGLANLAYVEDYSYPSVIYDGSYLHTESAAEYFKEVWENSGMDVCNMQSIYEGQTDFSDEVDNIENDECDSIVIFSYDDEMVGIIEELHDQYIDIGMFGSSVDPEYFIDSFEDDYDVDGVYTMTYSTQWDVHNPAVREHVDEECNDRSNDCDSYIYYHESYDTVKIIAEAFVMSGGDYDDVNSFIYDIGVTYIGATYSMFFDMNGDVRGPGHDICEFSGGSSSAYYNCDGIWQPRFGVLYDDTVVNVPLGFLNPLTGPIAIYAEGFTVSWDVAEDHLNEIYGFLNFEMNEQDSGCDGTTAANAAQSLVDSGVYAIAGAACSGATLGAMEVTSDNQIPQVAYPSTSPALTTADDDGYLFRVVPSDAQQGQAIGDLVAYYGLENPALLYMTNDYGAGTANSVEDRLSENSIEICVKIGYDDGETDFYYEVEEIKDNGCDSMVMISYADDGAAIIEELRDQDVNIPVFGGDGIADQAFLNYLSDPSDAEGVFATKPVWGGNTIEGEYFMADYDEKCDDEYNGGDCEENGIYLHEAYDSVMILGRAIYDAGYSGLGSGGDEGETIRDMLPYVGKSYQGASGLIDFDENGDISGSGYDICRFEYDDEGDDLQFVCRGTWTLKWSLRGVDFEIDEADTYEVPTAIIYSHTQIAFVSGSGAFFYGYGEAYGGEDIIAYEWSSDIDSVFGDDYFVSNPYLSVGAHDISFRVQDSTGNWSEPVIIQFYLYEKPKLVIDKTVGSPCDHCDPLYYYDNEIYWHPEFAEIYDQDNTGILDNEKFEVYVCVSFEDADELDCENFYRYEYISFFDYDGDEYVANYSVDRTAYGHYEVTVAFYLDYFGVWSEPDHFAYTTRDLNPRIVYEEKPFESIFGESVTFSAHGSYNSDCGEYCGDITAYTWTSDVDGILSDDDFFITDGLSAGEHTITFTIEISYDGSGGYYNLVFDSYKFKVYTLPEAHAGADVIVEPGTTVQFGGAGIDEDGFISIYEWDFNGDGIFEFWSFQNGVTTYIYNIEGVFVVTLKVTDNDGFTAIDELTVTVVVEEEEIVVVGCTNNEAPNFVPNATEDDGSCEFEIEEETETEPEVTVPEDTGLPSLSLVASIVSITIIALRRRQTL